MDIDPSTTKYIIETELKADGIVEKPDVVGAIFGQTEGLLGDELDLRDLQKSGRMGRIEVEVSSSNGNSSGEILIPSSLDLVETSILAAALETIDRVGPCKANLEIKEIRDVRESKRKRIVDRAKELLSETLEESKVATGNLTDTVRQEVQMEEISRFGDAKSPAGPNVKNSDAIIVVEGRSDVLNLLRYGIKNAIAVEGTNVPEAIKQLSSERVTTAFVDGDRGGDLILKELLETSEIDYVAEAPKSHEVEELTQKQIMKALRNKIPLDQYLEMYDIEVKGEKLSPEDAKKTRKPSKKTKKKEKKAKKKEKKVEEKKEKTEYQKYNDILKEVKGDKKAVLLDEKGKRVDELETKDLSEKLEDIPDSVKMVIFDGIVTQRLVDIASKSGIETLVARKVSSMPKVPTSLEILSGDDLKNA